MAKGDLFLYVAVFTIDGVKHVMGGHTESEDTMRRHVRQIIDARNANVPSEKAVVDDADMKFKPTDEEATAIVEAVRAEHAEGENATDLSAQPNLLLHKSKQQIRDDQGTEEAENIAAQLH